MNRQEFSWALQAVIPHAGSTGTVMADVDKLAATDSFTAGVVEDLDLGCYFEMERREAQALERWVRPERAADREQEVRLATNVQNLELHVGLFDHGDVLDSAVFDMLDPEREIVGPRMTAILRSVSEIRWFAKSGGESAPLVVANPDFLSRFAKAAQNGSPMALYGRLRHGITMAYVEVPPKFYGAVMGLPKERAAA